MRFRSILDLTDEEIIFILTDVFKADKVENIRRLNVGIELVVADVTTKGWESQNMNGEVIFETAIDEISFDYSSFHSPFLSTTETDDRKLRQFLITKGCNLLLKDNPYLKE